MAVDAQRRGGQNPPLWGFDDRQFYLNDQQTRKVDPGPAEMLGWLVYSERLDAFTVLGAVLILTGNLLNLRSADPVPARAVT